MTEPSIPELPEPVVHCLRQDATPLMWDQVADRYKNDSDVLGLHTADQMRSFGRQCYEAGVARTRQLCAQEALDEMVEGAMIDGKLCEGDEAYNLACEHVASAIRKG